MSERALSKAGPERVGFPCQAVRDGRPTHFVLLRAVRGWVPFRNMRPGTSVIACLFALTASCGGGQDLTAEQLSAVVNEGRPALEECYQRSLDKSPKKDELRVQVIIHVEPSGAVSKVGLNLSDDPALSDCVRGAIAAMRFPKAEVGTQASLPLIFRPEEGS